MRIGILTSGGDCSGLNPVIRGFVKYVVREIPGAEIYGFRNGYLGLMTRDYVILQEKDVENILDQGGTILGSIRQPYKLMTVSENGEPTKLQIMVENYRKLKLDCLVTMGGAGTHKTASLLSVEGCNVIGLPKTIDNDIYGTDVTFGFHSAVEVATEAIGRIKTTAESHARTFFVEVMGNKVGWLTLYSGIAGGADGVFIPEIPYNMDAVCEWVSKRKAEGHRSTLVAVAEGAMSTDEMAMDKKERRAYLESTDKTVSERLAATVSARCGVEARASVLGYIQRGGAPSAYDKLLSTEIGACGGACVKNGQFGVSVCYRGGKLTCNALTDIAGRAKVVPPDHQFVRLARSMGIYFGD